VSRVTFPPKLAGTTQTYTFDFISNLAPGETITPQSVIVAVYSGTDPNPGMMLAGSASVTNITQVLQNLTGGVLGTIYEVACTVTTSLGQTLVLSAYLVIVPDLV
jgi:hypothetical protein